MTTLNQFFIAEELIFFIHKTIKLLNIFLIIMRNLCPQYRNWMCEFGPKISPINYYSGYVAPNKEQRRIIKV